MFTGASSVVLDRGDYTTCTINRQGATVTSWRVRNIELVFLGRTARLYKFNTVRGGINMIFPYIGVSDKGMHHGFSRATQWDIEDGPNYDKAGNAYVTLSLTHNNWTESLWNFQFKIYYTVLLMESTLKFTLCVENLSSAIPFRFNFLQHSYLRVPDVSKCTVRGLKGCKYYDIIHDTTGREEDEEVSVTKQTDRLYRAVEKHLYVTNVMDEGIFKITRDSKMPDFCLWNPWSDGVKKLPHLGELHHIV
ncbi:unnamed protein product [Acanthoscelides obtectus]|uniref:Galactose mutarotase n=1 Tax=Acanthoscelides obtectus TaxID=200917 RepID=A0A9P0KC64_ACAOB|nr:unnamed protein product [Acanthoscelides obtectus]CAK1635240.1 Glucose-6-phosphate 1-epimerase [Acanthoscelides obtectus]